MNVHFKLTVKLQCATMYCSYSFCVRVCMYVRVHRQKDIVFSLLRSTHSPLLYMRAPVPKQRPRTSERVYEHEYERASTAGNSVPVASYWLYASRNLWFAVNVTDVQKYSNFRTNNTWYLVPGITRRAYAASRKTYIPLAEFAVQPIGVRPHVSSLRLRAEHRLRAGLLLASLADQCWC